MLGRLALDSTHGGPALWTGDAYGGVLIDLPIGSSAAALLLHLAARRRSHDPHEGRGVTGAATSRGAAVSRAQNQRRGTAMSPATARAAMSVR